MDKKAYLIVGLMWLGISLTVLLTAPDGPTIDRSRVSITVFFMAIGSFFTGKYVGEMK